MGSTRSCTAFQGEPGAFSHVACDAALAGTEVLPCETFEDTFSAVAEGMADRAMIPVENSLYGRVADIYHLLPRSGLFIIGEHFQPIELCLLGLGGTRIEDISRVHSHTVALGQCRRFIERHDLKMTVNADTAGAARHVAALEDPTQGAIASRLAGEISGLEVVAANVEDARHNTTRFLIMARDPIALEARAGRAITTFVFRVRNVPAALYKALGGFATTGVNMVKLESYMLEGSFTATQFYADVAGHVADEAVQLALEELSYFTDELRILGTYPESPYRLRQNVPTPR